MHVGLWVIQYGITEILRKEKNIEYILSFDIAKGKSIYCLIDKSKNIMIKPTSINHNKKEFDTLFDNIKPYRHLTVVMKSFK